MYGSLLFLSLTILCTKRSQAEALASDESRRRKERMEDKESLVQAVARQLNLGGAVANATRRMSNATRRIFSRASSRKPSTEFSIDTAYRQQHELTSLHTTIQQNCSESLSVVRGADHIRAGGSDKQEEVEPRTLLSSEEDRVEDKDMQPAQI